MYEPLGLAYLAAAAREAGHEPMILDCVAEGWRERRKVGELSRIGLAEDEIERRVRAFAPDVVGITSQFTGFEDDALATAAIVRRALPGTPILVGGADASARPEELSRDPNVDVLVRSEGEAALLDWLARYAATGRIPVDVPGTAVDGRLNPDAELIADLDALPLPARDLIPMTTYLEDQTVLMPYAKRRPVGFMISSRGCPYRCIFCSTSRVWKRWRPRSPVSVVDELEMLANDYGVREVAFQDDSFLVDPARVIAICDEIKRRKLDLSWTVPPGLMVQKVTFEVLAAMKEAGFYRACLPIESGDPEMLEYIRKPLDLDHVRRVIAWCDRLGIWTYGNFIIGFPEQTPESVEKTAAYAESCGLDMISVYVAQPYAGSELYEVFDALGLLGVPDAQASTVFHTRYNTRYFTAEELRAKRDEIYRRFMKRRLRSLLTPSGLAAMFRKVNRPDRFVYGMRVFMTLVSASLKARKFDLFSN